MKKLMLVLAAMFAVTASAQSWPERPESYSYVDSSGYVYNCQAIRYVVTQSYTGWQWRCDRTGQIVTRIGAPE